MDAAEKLILDQGYSATSVDAMVKAAGITKGAFFYHFAAKGDLALALVERYAELDLGNLENNMSRAEQLSRDPLQQMLIFIGLFREMLDGLTEPYPGCLFASYCYESELFDPKTMDVIEATLRAWRTRLGAKFTDIMAKTPPRLPADPDALSDMMTAILEGAFIMSRTFKEPALVADQISLYRDYIELLFEPRNESPPPPQSE
jgi:TetR/AcrR family transcriptional repressor of nem operon